MPSFNGIYQVEDKVREIIKKNVEAHIGESGKFKNIT